MADHAEAAEPGTVGGSEPGSATGGATVSGVTLAYALFGGIAIWMVHLIGQAWMTGSTCARGISWPYHLVTGIALVGLAHTLQVSWRITHPRTGPGTASPRTEAAVMLGWLALVINVFNVVLVVAEWSPVLFLDPCAVL